MAKPQLRDVSMALIDDPRAPARSAMDESKLQELADSIRQVGVIEPIVVARRGARFEVVAGHRRRIAAQIAALSSVPCVIHDDFKTAEEAVTLHENIYREDLNPVDEAKFFQRLLARVDGDSDRLADLVKQRREHVESRLQLLTGDPDVLAALGRGGITLGVAAELNLYEHPPTRRAHLQLAEKGGSTTAIVRSWRKQANEFHQLQLTRADAPEVTENVAAALPTVEPIKCYFCDGSEDVHTMQQIFIHGPCKRMLRNALARGIEDRG